MKIIVTGLAGCGKTQFIESISQYTEWQGSPGEGWFFGRVRVDEQLILHFYEPPAQREFDFLHQREVISRLRATGFVVLVDSTRPQDFGQFLSVLYTVRGYHAGGAMVVAANKQDDTRAWSARDIQLGLGIRDLVVIPCVATDHYDVREIIIAVLRQVLR